MSEVTRLLRRLPTRLMTRFLKCVLALLAGLALSPVAHACTSGGCVSAGPRLASVSSTQSVLLNTLLGSLTGSSLSVTVVDWNAIASGDVSLVKTLSALQATLVVASPQTALNTPITLGQLTGAMSTAASQDGLTSLSVALGNMGAQWSVPTTITLGSLLTSDGLEGTTRINALSLVSGAAELFNTTNVATTPTPVTVSGVSLGQSGTISSVQISAQAVEPPVYVCGPTGSTFHSSAIRVALAMTLATLTPSTSTLSGISPGTSLTLGQMQVYVEVAHASGIITAVNAISNAMTVQVTPGIAALYLGTISDTVFFNRSHAIVPATDLSWSTIGSLHILGTDVAVLAKAAGVGDAASPTSLSFSGAGVQVQTVSAGTTSVSTLVSRLFGTLQVSVSPSLGAVTDGLLLPLLNTIVSNALSPVLTSLTSGLIDPLLGTLGVHLAQVDVTGGGEMLECGVSGCVYADVNHNVRQDSGETGTGLTLYAKLVPVATPTVASLVVAVDPTTGNYSFAALNPATYTVVINGNNSVSSVAPALPSGWVGTENPTLSRAVTVSTLDLANQRFGLFHGSTLAGTVFKDNGIGSGVANNGIKDGAEAAIGGTLVSVTDSTGTTVYDSVRTDIAGAYILWVPSSAGTGVLKVAQAADPQTVFVSGRSGTTGGAFAAAGAVTSFTHVIGSVYTGVDFGDVPINRLDTDGQQSVAAGTTARYSHAFHAGSAGQLTLSVTPLAAAPTGWSATSFIDANCNGQLDGGETPITGAIAVVADQTLCVIVKVFAPATASNDTRTTYLLSGAFAYANNTLASQVQRQDLTIVGTADGMLLVKTVDKSVASSGMVIFYTLTFTNQGAAAVNAVKIRDATPAWTVLDAASCGAMPTGVSACSVTAQPAVGAAGSVEFTLTGSVPSGGTGTVLFSVKVL